MATHPMVQPEPAARATPPPRRIYNPVQKDYVTFLETSAATSRERSLAEIELAPGGGNRVHYHKAFAERFEVLAELHVQVGKAIHILKPTQSAAALVTTLHRFFNPTAQPTRFLVELRPGHTGFEQAIQIAYGLAAAGKTTTDGSGMRCNCWRLLHGWLR
jgi:mannose-6-phosphate isomerase-like protein (cupin superfamily)